MRIISWFLLRVGLAWLEDRAVRLQGRFVVPHSAMQKATVVKKLKQIGSQHDRVLRHRH